MLYVLKPFLVLSKKKEKKAFVEDVEGEPLCHIFLQLFHLSRQILLVLYRIYLKKVICINLNFLASSDFFFGLPRAINFFV